MLRALRDNALVLPILVWCLSRLRSFGLLMGERYYQHVPYRGIVRVPVNSGRQFTVVAQGGQIENRLYWDGIFGHEPASMATWVRLAATAETVLDVGANSGIFALAAAAAGAVNVHAFEPLKRIHNILHTNIRLSGYQNVTPWHCAVGQFDGVAQLLDPGGDAPTSASLSAEFAKSHLTDTSVTNVAVISIDSWAGRNNIGKIDLIKIDVEGYEELALRGMEAVVHQYRPVILIEVLEEFEPKLRAVVDNIFGCTYTWTPVHEGQGHISRNVLLLPNALPA